MTLEHIDQDHPSQEQEGGTHHAYEDNAVETQGHDREGQEAEHDEEVGCGEPTEFGSGATEDLAQRNGESGRYRGCSENEHICYLQ